MAHRPLPRRLKHLAELRASMVCGCEWCLDYATAMSRTPVEVSDELFAALKGRLDDRQLVELTNIIALENYRARFNWAVGLGSQGFSKGAICLAPLP